MNSASREPSAPVSQRGRTYFAFAVAALLVTFLYLGWELGQRKAAVVPAGNAAAGIPEIPDVSAVTTFTHAVQMAEPIGLGATDLLPPVDAIAPIAPVMPLHESSLIGIAAPIPPVADLFVVPEAVAATQPEPVRAPVYTVRRGDTLSGIAAKMLGDARRWPEIMTVNHLRQPQALRVGMTLTMPPPVPGTAAASVAAPVTASVAAPVIAPIVTPVIAPVAVVAPGSASVTPAAEATRFHVVRRGDTLQGISSRYYGTASHWRHIQEANGQLVPNERLLSVGLRLTIPPRP